MGNNSLNIQQQWSPQLLLQLKKSIDQNIKQRRLEWDHQNNIYQKTQFLLSNFNQFYKEQIDQILLGYNMISQKYMQLFSKIQPQKLQVLKFSNNNINCSGIKYMKLMKLIQLKHLFLDYNQISNDGCYYIMRMSLPMLQTLDLTHNFIQDQGAKNLSKANFPDLKTFLICQNKITQKGLIILGTSQWPTLAFVRARNNNYSSKKDLQYTKFRTQIKFFRLEIQ